MIGLVIGTALAGSWELAGLYDATAVARTGETVPTEWVWQPPAGIAASCGTAKSPDGLGVLEAQAVANGLTPALAVVLRRADPAAPPLDTDNVFLAVANGTEHVRLAPMVEQSWLAVEVDGDGLEAHAQLVRTQIAMEMCLQHKTGRRWSGGDWAGLRQAFLLDEPSVHESSDRMFYRGQRKPVAALLGPPDACFDADEGPAELALTSGASSEAAAATSLALVPSDVWGASLRDCALDEIPGATVRAPSPGLPLSLGGVLDQAMRMPPQWRRLQVTVQGTNDEDATIEVALDGRPLESGPLFRRYDDPVSKQKKLGLQDVLAMVPGRYPAVGDAEDPGRYTVLLVPNWQIVEAAASLHRKGGSDGGVADGVGWLLEHPEALVLQVGEPSQGSLPQLMSKYGTLEGRFLRWGYMVGMYAGRSEVVLPTPERPAWEQSERAQRSREHSLFLASAAVIVVLVLLGLRRLPELWLRVPEERVNYWPGTDAPAAEGGPDPATPLGDMAAGE